MSISSLLFLFVTSALSSFLHSTFLYYQKFKVFVIETSANKRESQTLNKTKKWNFIRSTHSTNIQRILTALPLFHRHSIHRQTPYGPHGPRRTHYRPDGPRWPPTAPGRLPTDPDGL